MPRCLYCLYCLPAPIWAAVLEPPGWVGEIGSSITGDAGIVQGRGWFQWIPRCLLYASMCRAVLCVPACACYGPPTAPSLAHPQHPMSIAGDTGHPQGFYSYQRARLDRPDLPGLRAASYLNMKLLSAIFYNAQDIEGCGHKFPPLNEHCGDYF
ncbi:hypothetical protein GQ42DRAFT_159220 [Ramicandelaber brevisporus]|nr:hypothetical protein GQ42DRAFT_159220 [Ramicandelaber brevisporus]